MRNVLIIGKDSYIGESIKKWLEQYPLQYETEIVSSLDGEWKKEDFSRYDTVIDCAGIAHINNITEDMKELFYSINRDLSIEIAKWAKERKIKQFIIFSSMNVYGDYVDNLVDRNKENPTSFYGDSKMQGDIGIRKIEDDDFFVSFIRPPFVYGRGCKGNYNTISKIAKKTPVFPDYHNKKSMIYIDNLCEFVRLTIDNCERGILTPQNKELVSTVDLVDEIAKNNGKRLLKIKGFNWMIRPMCKKSRMFTKAFGNDNYSRELSDYWGYSYCVVDFKESVKRTEGC